MGTMMAMVWSNDGIQLGIPLGISQGTSVGTNDGVLNGDLDGILLGADISILDKVMMTMV